MVRESFISMHMHFTSGESWHLIYHSKPIIDLLGAEIAPQEGCGL